MSAEFKRKDKLFSLCGLNCSLCPSFVRGNCPGCQQGSHCALMCPFAPCSVALGYESEEHINEYESPRLDLDEILKIN